MEADFKTQTMTPRRTGFWRWLPAVVLAILALAPNVYASGGALPPGWTVLPFALLLAMIATGPLFYPHFWHHYYPHVALALGAVVVGFYLVVLGNGVTVLHTTAEYISFMALVGSLFVASGGILIKIDKKSKPLLNVAILFIGSLVANLIGTTGASMLLIRPFMRINQGRLKAYHIIFFIFTVSNVGGGLTPIGDPPLFLGFLKGIPFFWVFTHVWTIWLTGIVMILAIFFVFDTRNKDEAADQSYSGAISIQGQKNFLWLAIIIISVFLDPNVIREGALHNILAYPIHTLHLPLGFREVIMFAVLWLSYSMADKECLKGNEFNFEPIREVGFLFAGIFGTMMPALQLIADWAHKQGDALQVSHFYWFTGSLSGILDNAPTYLNFLSGAMGKFRMDISSIADVRAFASGSGSPETVGYLTAISIAAVFFGAMTYIGNAPNFMVKSIAEQAGVDCPSFVAYLVRYSLPILLPVFVLIWLLFFREGAAFPGGF